MNLYTHFFLRKIYMKKLISKPGVAVGGISGHIYTYIYAPGMSESIGNRFKTILLNQEMDLKKNPIEKYFFIMEKNDFENFGFQKKFKILIFSIEKLIFPSKCFTWKNWFFYWKNQNFQLFLKSKIFKIIFLHDEKIFFDGIFLNLISCSRRIVLKQF